MHPLDRPIGSALTSRQRSIAEGGERALRYQPAIAPFAATVDAEPESFADLHALMQPGERAALFTLDSVPAPPGFSVALAAEGEQMIGAVAPAPTPVADIVELDASDVPQMLELVALTKPGPFTPRTHELGRFLGIKRGERLLAMAGERMKLDGYTEITAVCTHPEHQGHGYARALLAAVSDMIVARGETPMLHVFSHNASAIALYQRVGMTHRQHFHVTVLEHAA